MSSGSQDGEATQHEWCESIRRFTELHPLFESTKLGITAKHAVAHLGLADNRSLRTWCEARQLPPFKVLRNWYYLVVMLERAERGEAIATWALRRGENPSVYYRFVLSLGGGAWEQWLARGSIEGKRRAMNLWAVFRV